MQKYHDEPKQYKGYLKSALVIPPGELIINSREVDAYYNPAGTGGYAPVANTVWTWYQIAPKELGFFLYFFSLARRTDAVLMPLSVKTLV